MKSLTQQLHMLGITSTNISYNAYEQDEFFFIKSNFDSFTYKDVDRLGDLLFQALKIERFSELAQIAMDTSVISHGQADVRRGFSIYTNVIAVNMKEQSIQSKRQARDHMQKQSPASHN